MRTRITALLGFLALALAFVGQASAQSRGNPSCAWGCKYTGSSSDEQYLRDVEALTDLGIRRGPTGNASGANAGTSNYYGTVNNTYTGPHSNSGSNVLNIQNMNETTTTATGGSTVTTTTTQTATGGVQSGAASANAATGNNATQSSSPSATSN